MKQFIEDGHKHHFNGDGHIHEFNDDGHVLHFNGDGHTHQLNNNVRSFSRNGYARKLNNDNHNHHFNGDGDNHQFNDNGHVLHFNKDGHLHSLNDELLINGNSGGNNQRQLSGAFLFPPSKSLNHIVNAPLDDDDLSLVQETFQDQTINKTGQLRYSALPIVEKALIKDIVRIILKDEEYMILLSNPSFPEVVKMVRTMLRKPIQDVLQQQIWNKVLAIEAYYKKFYQPLNNPENKRESMNFLTHLKEASDEHKLTVDDTVKLNEKMEILAFLIQEKEFNQRISDLEATIKEEGEAFKEKHYSRKNAINKNSSTTASTPVTVNVTTVEVIATTTPSNASTTDTSVTSSYNTSLPTTDASLISTTTNSTTTESIYTGTNSTVTSNTTFNPISAVLNITTTEITPSTNVTKDSKKDASSTGSPIRRNFAENFNPYVGGAHSERDSYNPEETDEGDDY
ncbi:Protein CBG22692 [Caenorhabditis briggsae]|uniref:Protein CBG22692 n=1 Tax=Caenorhabditis briggsae TaxID=6238 RepID=A8Y2Y8_CAEBR|nr:Protein CBG22692 [Caenorhabditis briggsae]CAP39229.1 Protein CBG22692 [Caenorhabditis briggsae]